MANNFKVGDKVRLKNRRGANWNSSGLMDKYIGAVVTIESLGENTFTIEEDKAWLFNVDDIECLANKFTKADLQEGDIITLRNGDRLFVGNDVIKDVNGLFDNSICGLIDINDDLTRRTGNTNEDIVKVERPVSYTTVYEREEVKEMTLKEVCDALGYNVKIVKEEN